jgi:hypothetical protein
VILKPFGKAGINFEVMPFQMFGVLSARLEKESSNNLATGRNRRIN